MDTNALLEKKYSALQDFIARVRKSEVGDDVVKMILYGSVLHGEAHEESDVDVLVIATGDVRVVGRTVGHIAYDVMLEYDEMVSPMVYCPDDYRHPHYFVRSVKKVGKEVYSVEEKAMWRKEAHDLLALARSFLAMARSLEGTRENARGIIDLAYNAAELSAKGLLLAKEGSWPKSHGGVVQQFGRVFVVEGKLVEPEVGRALHQGLELRNRARYDPHATLTRDDAEEITKLATKLIEVLQQELAK